MTPRLIKYPGEAFAGYNASLLAGFKKGRYSFAVDVWRDGAHLWRSYTEEESEDLDSWCRRNMPEMLHPDYDGSTWGFGPAMGGMDRFPIPTRAALFLPTSIPDVEAILRACLGIAQLPNKPRRLDIVPNANTIRQRLHQRRHQGWATFRIVDKDSGVLIRVLVAKAEEAGKESAKYAAELIPNDENAQTLKFDYVGPSVDMEDTTGRKGLTTAVKRLASLTGHGSTVIAADPIKYRLRCPTIDAELEIRKVEIIPGKAKDCSGFDTVT
jgi:hypothetical protein